MAASRRTEHARVVLAPASNQQTIAAPHAVEATALAVSPLLRLLSDPTRLCIFLLLREGEACVCELASTLGLAENLVSHHLGVLRRAGLVRDRRDASDARWVYYTLDAAALDRALVAVSALFDLRTLGTRIPTCGPAASALASSPAACCGLDACGGEGGGIGQH